MHTRGAPEPGEPAGAWGVVPHFARAGAGGCPGESDIRGHISESLLKEVDPWSGTSSVRGQSTYLTDLIHDAQTTTSRWTLSLGPSALDTEHQFRRLMSSELRELTTYTSGWPVSPATSPPTAALACRVECLLGCEMRTLTQALLKLGRTGQSLSASCGACLGRGHWAKPQP